MTKSLIVVALVAFSSALVSCQSSRGQPPLQQNFDAAKYMGRWYQIYRPANITYEIGTDSFEDYIANANGTVSFTHAEWWPHQLKWSVSRTLARVVDPSEPAWWTVRFPKGNGEFIDEDYRVLYTDYKTVTVIYSEQEVQGRTMRGGYVFGRERVLPDIVADMALTLLASRGINKNSFNKTIHGPAYTTYWTPVVVQPAWYQPVQYRWSNWPFYTF